MHSPVEFLLTNGSPSIRFRTRVELMGEPVESVFSEEKTNLLVYPLLQQWLAKLRPLTNFNSLHGSDPGTLENVAGKLNDLGFQPWMLPSFQNDLKPHLNALAQEPGDHGLSIFAHQGLANYLLVLGASSDILKHAVLEHLDQLADFVSKDIYDLYIDQNTFGAFPRSFLDKPLINPEYNNLLPVIWDIHAFSRFPADWRTPEVNRKIDAVLRYVLDDRYRALPRGYGAMYHPPAKRYYAMGWSIELPYPDTLEEIPAFFKPMFLKNVALMTQFKSACDHPWLTDSIQFLQRYQIDDGIWQLPGEFLTERPSGYWVSGAYMRLEQNYRQKMALQLDSTFRMCLIQHHLDSTRCSNG